MVISRAIRGATVYYIVIKGSTKPKKLFELNGSFVEIANILHEYDMGRLKDIHRKLQELPACFGPLVDRALAEHLACLLTGAGMILEVSEHL